MREYLIASESATEGHPDKICDQISDAILDACLCEDPDSRVAIECMISKDCLMIAGEISSAAKPDAAKIAREIIKEIGYDDERSGFDYKNCLILTNINKQSQDIANGVCGDGFLGAGDQGIMYGYACDETENLLPAPIFFATALAKRLAKARKDNLIPWLLPDGKTQVAVKYENDAPKEIASIVVSAQHMENVSRAHIYKSIMNDVIYETIPSKWLSKKTKFHINPSGRFVIGGPLGDTGLTGRKIISDAYGGVSGHGGGAFSGKDATKVDRSGAYMARYVAKNLVAAGLCKKCEISLAYAIGKPDPEAVRANSFGSSIIDDGVLEDIVKEVFSFSVADIIGVLDLKKAQFLKTSVYGHFGKEDCGFAWEETNKITDLKIKCLERIVKNLNF